MAFFIGRCWRSIGYINWGRCRWTIDGELQHFPCKKIQLYPSQRHHYLDVHPSCCGIQLTLMNWGYSLYKWGPKDYISTSKRNCTPTCVLLAFYISLFPFSDVETLQGFHRKLCTFFMEVRLATPEVLHFFWVIVSKFTLFWVLHLFSIFILGTTFVCLFCILDLSVTCSPPIFIGLFRRSRLSNVGHLSRVWCQDSRGASVSHIVT